MVYHLHGILCDDMGLGKTLQTICIVASDHHIRAEKFKETGSPEFKRISSLIVCPPSLTGHWEQEFARFAPFMSVLVYAGPPAIRSQLRAGMSKYDVIVTSYDVVRNDCEYMTQKNYNYCVLDEGHIIRNAHTRLTISVKKVKSEHRLILTGTPIQNNVLELWSLFDFLMPGFLGTEKAFNDKFVKPISTSRTSKGSKDQEAGALALETLHKQVLPFMLRRLKEDVLSDLPPKIIQDYYCELSSLQKQLYHDFISKQKGSVKKDISTSNQGGKKHIFQVLQYMRKLCNSPALVVTPNHPQYNDVKSYLGKYNMDLRDIHYAPKLMALKNLLKECGIGLSGNSSSKNKAHDVLQDNVISQHRALIFCQMRDMLDIVENDLLKKHMPDVTYLRMDGSTDPRYRQQIVSKFNGDPSIDVLLLTTKVGGLGLNLTGADTVIFVEHDWNPMNDLQAMDRAHRIGQKKVVNVYRLITKGTLEEKIMGLQKFKLNIANTVVNQQNAGLSSMNSNQLLDLFGEDAEKATKGDKSDQEEAEEGEEPDDTQETSNKGPDDRSVPNEVGLSGKAGKAVTSLGKLWDESQYEEEYNLDSFLKTLK
ncbi:TATA-binding protein-associated factor mot1 [Brettanomyces bruxellensis]|uniref:TATA-binding protein-associated factor mot1 n=1 Tax=Dekkera bruxellensis TaxID=5007 RepID=A0A8H6B6K1_DEKBR|nr:TATA-binding protein-associated factor mot1 [Brettanomyces bruxellensis]